MKSVPPWLTKVLMLVALAIGYVMNHALIPPGYMLNLGFIHVSLAGILNDVLAVLTALGISGPQLWPKLAALMGNPAAAPTAPAPPPAVPKT